MKLKLTPGYWVAIGVTIIAVSVAGNCLLNHSYQRSQKKYKQDIALTKAISLAKDGRAMQALPVLTDFARDGDLVAMQTVAEIYSLGIGAPYDERRALLWARMISATGEKNSRGDFEYAVADSYLKGINVTVNVERGIYWLERAATAGNLSAQRKLSNSSEGVSQESADYWRSFLRAERLDGDEAGKDGHP